MPEGDTIYRTAEALRRALLGKTITRFESRLPTLRQAGAATPLAGRTVSSVEARGKHLLIRFGDPAAPVPEDPVLHTHMQMTGSWHLYRHGERWQKPERLAVVVLQTAEFVAPNAPNNPLRHLANFGRTRPVPSH